MGPAALTITLANLATGSARQSAVIDNTSTLYQDILLGGSFNTAAGALGTNPTIYVYVSGLSRGADFGGTWDKSVAAKTIGGGDGPFTFPTSRGNLIQAAQIPINTANKEEVMEPISLSRIFGGPLPRKMVVIIENQTSLALDLTTPGGLEITGVLSSIV